MKSAMWLAREKAYPLHVLENATPEQHASLMRVILRQGKKHLRQIYPEMTGGAIMVQFDHIVIGIEPDGYAHS